MTQLLRATRIAHLSDLHVLETRPGWTRTGYGFRVRFLSFGRRLDALGRKKKIERAFRAAERAGANQFVVSGDLTEIGTPEQFESLAEVLHDTGIAPERITLVPGNHDAYTSPLGWRTALEGPLRAFRNVAREPGHVVDAGDVCILPLDVTCPQPVTRSAGEISEDAVRSVSRRAVDSSLASKACVLVMHHPPFERGTAALQWMDGLRGWFPLMALLERLPSLHVMHGHLHRVVTRALGDRTRIFGAPAIVDDEEAVPRVRLYDVRDGVLESAGLAAA